MRLLENINFKLFSRFDRSTFNEIQEFIKERQKQEQFEQSRRFLVRCQKSQIFPKFIQHQFSRIEKANYNFKTISLIKNLKEQLLLQAISNCRRQYFISRDRASKIELKLQNSLSHRDYRIILSVTSQSVKSLGYKIRHKLSHNYQSLIYHRHKKPYMSSTTAQPTEIKATVIGNANITESEISLLSLGPSFSPAIRSSSNLHKQLFTNFQAMADALRSKQHHDPTTPPQTTNETTNTSTTKKSNLLYNCPFEEANPTFAPPAPILEPKFVMLWSSIEKAFSNHIHLKNDNLSPQQRINLKSLISRVKNGEIRISTSDKGGEFVIIPQKLDQEITLRHLKDKTLYAKATKAEFDQYSKAINETWKKAAGTANLPDKTEKKLNTTEPSMPVMYTLIKTHKLSTSTLISKNPDDYKIRPIISGCGGPPDKVSWYLSRILSPLLKFIPSYISNTNQFLNQLNGQNIPPDKHVHYCSYDIENLYTNVDNKEAIQTIMDMIKSHQNQLDLFNMPPTFIQDLLSKIFKTNIFVFMDVIYKQLRGLAMGNRLAPILAIIFVHKIESSIIQTLRPIIFVRYIDDTFTITNTADELDVLFQKLNDAHPQIKFTRENPTEAGLPFLNCNIKHFTNGKFITSWYRKPTSKNIVLHANSDHPGYMKQNVIRNMLITALNLSSTPEEKEEAKKLANKIAISNGYTGCTFNKIKGPGKFKEGNVNFSIPFITDEFTSEISTLIKKSGLPISISVTPSPNLKKVLTKSRLYETKCDTKDCQICPKNNPGDCNFKGVVYKLKCEECDEEYIGHTGRKTKTRISEHFRNLKNPNASSYESKPLAVHRNSKHNGKLTNVTVEILERESKSRKRLILEANHISIQKPAINDKKEQEEILQLLMPSKKYFAPREPLDAFLQLFKNFEN